MREIFHCLLVFPTLSPPSGSIHSSLLLLNFLKSVTFIFLKFQKYIMCPKFSNSFASTERKICPLPFTYPLCKYINI